MPGVKITGIGGYVPEKVVTNRELARDLNRRVREVTQRRWSCQVDQQLLRQFLIGSIGEDIPASVVGEIANEIGGRLKALLRRGEQPQSGWMERVLERLTTSSLWIRQRTGIKQRHIAAPDQATSDLAVMAIKRCFGISGLYPMDNSFLVVSTVLGDYLHSPTTGPAIQHKLEWPVRRPPDRKYPEGRLIDRMVVDVQAACTSFLTALYYGEALIRSGNRKVGYIVGADIMSRTVNRLNRAFSIVLGDGAFAVSLEGATDPSEDCFLPDGRSFFFGCDGRYGDKIITRAGGTAQPVTIQMLADPLGVQNTLDMQGNQVFQLLVRLVEQEVVPQALAKAGLKLRDIDLFVFHQANVRIINSITRFLRIGSRTINNLDQVANTTSASTGLPLIKAMSEGRLKPGMRVMIIVYGGGFTWGTCIVRWPQLSFDDGDLKL